jgi:hypothetical protein
MDNSNLDLARMFLEPRNSTHRQYEALRAFFVEGRPQAEVARDFGYSVGSFRVLCCKFRQNPDREFFVKSKRGRRRAIPERDDLRSRIIALRKRNLSIYDIEKQLTADGHSLTAPTISSMLKEEGFERLPPMRLGRIPSPLLI